MTESNIQSAMVKLSQWEALMLESLKAYGWSHDELIRNIRSAQLPEDESPFKFNYADLITLANEHEETLDRAVREGYRIKYNTLRGIHSWITIALQLQSELILDPDQECIKLSLTAAQYDRVAAVLSVGWVVEALSDEANKQRYIIKLQ